MTLEPKHRIVVVDDEADLRTSVAEYLQLQGFAVSQAADGASLRALLVREPIDLVLLDLRMPGEDGIAVLRGIREHFGTPVIMVTAIGDPIDRIVGLEVGADDYVIKPFEFRELLARIRTVLRRAPSSVAAGVSSHPEPAPTRGRVQVGRYMLDLEARRLVDNGGAEISLTGMEFDLLRVLVENPNRVLTRDQLFEQAHNDSWDPLDRSIDIRVARL